MQIKQTLEGQILHDQIAYVLILIKVKGFVFDDVEVLQALDILKILLQEDGVLALELHYLHGILFLGFLMDTPIYYSVRPFS